MFKTKSPTILIVLDGWGVAPPSKYNAITLAKKPNMDRFYEQYPSTTLGATGLNVGLEDNKMSGSEAGHLNIGAGRIVEQDSWYITKSILDGSFFTNPALTGAVQHVKKFGSKFHVMGLMGNSDSPHSDPEHFRAVLRIAKSNGLREAYCHLFTDGRDSYPKSALEHLKKFQSIMREERIGKIATISGRFYAMDRAKNWKRLTKAYDAIVFSRNKFADSAEEAIKDAYKNGLTDEYILPTVILEKGKPIMKLEANDSLVFYNLRSDRARQFAKLFVAMNKNRIISDDMPIIDKIKNIYFAAMTDFGPDLDVHTAFPGHTLSSTFPMALSNLKQLYIAESEKFAHVTYFLNGGYADPVGGEERVMIDSLEADSYVKFPEMSAKVITNTVSLYIQNNIYDVIVINFANADMVGHSGDLKAVIKAVEVLDEQVGLLVSEALKKKGNVIITADHGNAEDMFDEKENQPNTFHAKNPVPFLLVSDKFKGKKLAEGGVLGNIAPTVLDILGIDKPKLMDRKSLLNC